MDGRTRVILRRCDALADALRTTIHSPHASDEYRLSLLGWIDWEAQHVASSCQRALGIRDRHYDPPAPC